jgi:hypothetical protein
MEYIGDNKLYANRAITSIKILTMHRFEIKTLQGIVLALLLEHPPKAK